MSIIIIISSSSIIMFIIIMLYHIISYNIYAARRRIAHAARDAHGLARPRRTFLGLGPKWLLAERLLSSLRLKEPLCWLKGNIIGISL